MRPTYLPARRRALAALSVAFLAPLTRAAGQADATSILSRYGAAPEFQGIDTWLNSGPLTIAALRGNVVMVHVWTHGCINCIHTLPHVVQWHEKYRDRGLTIVGIHTPEFAFERETGNVKRAIERHGIRYAVGQDNKFATWNAYRNRYWPTAYLVDRNGELVFKHAGEGLYEETERAIQLLLA